MSRNLFKTRICERCGREFVVAPSHIFKEGGKYYCKWTCYTHRNDKTEYEESPMFGKAKEDEKD